MQASLLFKECPPPSLPPPQVYCVMIQIWVKGQTVISEQSYVKQTKKILFFQEEFLT